MADYRDSTERLEAAHNEFREGKHVSGGRVRRQILTSWQRCQWAGLTPEHVDVLHDQDLDLDSRLVRAAAPVLDQLETSLSGIRVTAVVCDEQARILDRRVGLLALRRALDMSLLAPGFGFPEPIAGTNGIGTAVAERMPVLISGREHFADTLQRFTCAAAPIRHPLSGRIEGALDLTCLQAHADPVMLNIVSDAARSVEHRLLDQETERERSLLRELGEAARGGPAGAVPLGHGGPIDAVIAPHEETALREKAAELVSAARPAIVEVPLSGARAAILLCRLAIGADGKPAAAVEAFLAGGALRQPICVSRPVRPVTQRPARSPGRGKSPQRAPSPSPRISARQPGATDRWLLLAGEPSVGRIAIAARQRLALIFEAGTRIGTTLDVTRTAEELAEVAAPGFADLVTVDLHSAVRCGAGRASGDNALLRAAARGVRPGWPVSQAGELTCYAAAAPQARCLATAQPVFEPAVKAAPGRAQEPGRGEELTGLEIHSLIVVPLRARGTVLGLASFYRCEQPDPFEDDDLNLAEELASRAAVCIDNARRYTREHTTALALQRSMLPKHAPEQNAIEVAHRYLPAHAGVGGDWFDVIPLSGCRVAMVVGDVVGHGLHAAATMGRLRTAVHNFSALDLPADDVLAYLDDLVIRLDEDDAGESGGGMTGTTCLYAIYDPTSGRCAMAAAGHPPPALVRPDGTVEFVDLPAGPPLGLGASPFETVEVDLPAGGQLVLYTDGLIEDRARDLDDGLALLRDALAGPGRTAEATCEAVLASVLPSPPGDDVALLVGRARGMDPGLVASWELAADPALAAPARAAVAGQLGRWGLGDDAVFTTQVIVSEMFANAIRYGAEPIRLRLLRDRTLICEISDGSSTSPRLRRADSTDEGGRGLFLVAQLAQRWGARYTESGKVIWAEQALPGQAAARGAYPRSAGGRQPDPGMSRI